MSQSIFSGDFVDLSLGQLGASKIKTVNGQQHVVHFDLGEGKELVYARKSRKYQDFVDIAHKTIALTQQMEDLFITHNISTEDMALLHQQTDRLTKLMEEIHSRSPEV